MDRRVAFGALWAVAAALSVAVGFGAANLVGDPFTDGVAAGSPVASGATEPASEQPTPSASGGATSSTAPPGSVSAAPPDSEPVTRSVQTRGGLVTATCRAGAVRLSVAPGVGWTVEDLDPPGRESRVRFEPTGDRDGRVEVRARCVSGRPSFELDDDTGDD